MARSDEHVVMCMLDALLDTRIATVARLYPSEAKALLSPHYRNRHSDEFRFFIKDFDQEKYDKAFAERDVETLKIARPTDMVVHLADILADLQHQIDNGSPTVKRLTVEINVWPYKLTKEEQVELVACIAERCRVMLPFKAVSIPYSEMDYDHIRGNNYSMMVIYDWREWVLQSHRRYKERPQGCPAVSLVVPALVPTVEAIKDDKQFDLPNGYTIDPYDAVGMALADLIGFTFLPPSAFSLIDPSEKEVISPSGPEKI